MILFRHRTPPLPPPSHFLQGSPALQPIIRWDIRWRRTAKRQTGVFLKCFDLDGEGEEDAGYQEGAREMGKGNRRVGCCFPEAALSEAAGEAP